MAETVILYRSLHKRLRRQRGRAVDHVCECGAPAVHWAYQYTDPEPLRCIVKNCLYSLDLSHYAPMCRHCHDVLDKQHRKKD